jgi:pimeloyl-ACP methyl ester carboxylesterase
MVNVRRWSLLVVPLASWLNVAAAPPTPRPTLALQRCTLPGVAGEARCGTYAVAEKRGTQGGRRLDLRVVVLPATGKGPVAEPVVYFSGGPGESAVEEGAYLGGTHPGLRQRHDIVLVDLRGTGGSAPLTCDAMSGERGMQGFLDDFLPRAGVRACRRQHADRDLAQYRTAVAVDDVDEVLGALGYGPVDAWGASYGTRAALELLRRHPRRVRTLGLVGMVPPDARMPLTFARDAQDALDATLRECAHDATCAAAFPRVREDLAAALARLDRGAVLLSVQDAATGDVHRLRLDRHGFTQTLRYLLYVPSAAVLLPLYVHAAAGGDFAPMADMAATFARMMGSTSDGFYLSVTCAEDVAFISDAAAQTAAQGTFLDDFRIRAQREACKEWGVPAVETKALAPVVSDVPAFIFSGERDPVTPARWGAEVAKTLPHAVHLVVPDGGHGYEGMRGAECVERLLDELAEKGTTRGVDTSCVRAIARPPFVTELPAHAVTLSAAERARLLGTYVGEDGLTVNLEAAGDGLRATLVGEDSFLLTPRSPTRFGLAGMPPSYGVEAEEQDGKIVAIRLLGMHDEPVVLRRKP